MSQEEIRTLTESYVDAFTGYNDKEIQAAADEYAKDGDYFPPRPKHILALVKDTKAGKHDDDLRRMWTCNSCKQVTSTISDGVCLDCRGIPPVIYDRLSQLPDPDRVRYKIEGRIKCFQCGTVGQCIKEPLDDPDSPYLCIRCYTGKTRRQISVLFAKLAGRAVAPPWAGKEEEAPVRIPPAHDDDGDRIPF